VSGIVTFYLMCLPALRKMSGFTNPHLPKVQAKLGQKIQMDEERPEYHRCTLTWQTDNPNSYGYFLAKSTGRQISSRLLSMNNANALIIIPQKQGILEEGSIVDALIINNI
jgi:gephyrin